MEIGFRVLFSKHLFHRIHEWATRDKVCCLSDPVLGELVLNDSSWECTVESNAGSIVVRVGGRYEPDEGLIATARQTYAKIDDFVLTVNNYLSAEAQADVWKPFANELLELSIADINYWWPEKPSAAMIFFRGTDECKLWHCDIDGEQLFGLTFDS